MNKFTRSSYFIYQTRRSFALVRGVGKGGTISEYNLDIDDSAINRIKKLTKSDPVKYSSLRILVEGGGCAGFSYAFKMTGEENSQEEDQLEFCTNGVKILSDALTLEMINGSKIVYKEEMIRSAFEVTENP